MRTGLSMKAFLLAAILLLINFAAFTAPQSFVSLVGNPFQEPDPAQLQEALLSGADVNESGVGGTTPLLEAIVRKRPTSVRFLLENGADPNICNKNGTSPLAYAATQDYHEIAGMLIEAGANVHYADQNGTPVIEKADHNFKKDFTLVDLLVKSGARSEFIDPEKDPDQKNDKGETLLYRAVKARKKLAVAWLLRRGANPNLKTEKGITPLNAAMELEFSMFADIVRSLVEAGAEINLSAGQGSTPLLQAVTRNDADAVAFLIEHGAAVNVCNVASVTPLMSVEQSPGVMSLLIDAGADVGAVTADGLTPLHYVARKNDTDMAFLLLEAGADINARDASGTSPVFSTFSQRFRDHDDLMNFLDFLIDKGADINAPASDGKTLVELAEKHHDYTAVRYLLEKGACCNLNATESSEIATQTLILKAMQASRNSLACCLAETLASAAPLIVNDAGETLLHLAARNNLPELSRILLQKRFDPNFQRKDGQTALHIAVSSNREEIILDLLKAGADPHLADQKKSAPIDIARSYRYGLVFELLKHFNLSVTDEKEDHISLNEAIKKGMRSVVEEMLEASPNLQETDENGRTPLLNALKTGWLNLSRRMLELGAEVNIADKSGITPLHLAAAVGNRILVKKMLQKKARIDAFDEKGATPLFYAVAAGHIAMVELLYKNGANLKHVDKKGRSALFHAFRKDRDLVTFAWLVKNGVPVNARDDEGQTVLHEIINPVEDLRQIKKALKLGADLHVADNRGKTPFSVALCSSADELVEFILSLGLDFNRAGEEMGQVMSFWLSRQSYSLLERAFAAGVSPDLPDKKGNNLLVESVRRRDFAAAAMLIKAGASFGPVVVNASALLIEAISENRIDTLEWLAKHHIDLNLQTPAGTSILWHATCNWSGFDYLWNHGVRPDFAELLREELAGARSALLDSTEGRERLKQMTAAGLDLKKLVFNGENDINRHKNVFSWARQGNIEALKFAFELGFDLNVRGYNQNTLLHIASHGKNLQVIRQLLEWGADLEAENREELTPLQYAVKFHHNEAVIFLLENGADYTRKEKRNGAGLLHQAAWNSASPEVFKKLLSLNFAVNVRDNNGATPLLFAAENNCDKAVDYLLSAGADTNIATEVASSAQRTEVLRKGDFHFYKNDYFISNWLISGVGPLCRAALRGNEQILKRLLEKGARVEQADELGNTPLHLAVMGDSASAAEILLQAGAPVLVANSDGLTPLEIAESKDLLAIADAIWQKIPLHIISDPTEPAAEKDDQYTLHRATTEGKLHKLRWLIRGGADINGTDKEGRTPLWYAVQSANDRMIALLLRLGASPDVAGPDGETPWLKAFERGCNYSSLPLLASAGALIDSAGKNGDTALHIAARRGFAREVDFLLKQNAALAIRNQSGRTPLMEAILINDRQEEYEKGTMKIRQELEKRKALVKKLPAWRRPEELVIEDDSEERRVIELLIKKDPLYLNLADVFGQTALHLAARKTAPHLITRLIEAGCETEARDRNGRTPLFHAIAAGNSDNVEILLQQGARALAFDSSFETTVSLADSLGRDDIIEMLFNAGVEKKFLVPGWPEADENGRTRFMRAVAENRFAAVKLMLASREDLNRADKSGETALFYAVRGCNHEMVKLLLENGASIEKKNLQMQTVMTISEQLARETFSQNYTKGPANFFPEQKSYEDWGKMKQLLQPEK